MIARAALVIVGVGVMAFGAALALLAVPVAALPNLAVWLAAAVVIHDGVIGLMVAVTGWLLARVVPEGARAYVQGGFIVAAIVALSALPVVLGAGRTPTNPSLLPLDYPRNLLVVVAVVAVVTALLALVARRRSAGERQEDPAAAGP